MKSEHLGCRGGTDGSVLTRAVVNGRPGIVFTGVDLSVWADWCQDGQSWLMWVVFEQFFREKRSDCGYSSSTIYGLMDADAAMPMPGSGGSSVEREPGAAVCAPAPNFELLCVVYCMASM